MKKTVFYLALLSSAMMVSTAQAEPRWPNWYVGLHGGLDWFPDNNLVIAGSTSTLKSGNGYDFGAALGYVPPTDAAFFKNTRWELEYTYRNTDNRTVGGVPALGKTVADTYMFNAYYDFTNGSPFTPYLGAGVGAAHINFEDPTGGTLHDGRDNAFAWQLIGGLEYSPETIPMTSWGIQYRYLNTDGVHYTNALGLASQLDYEAHNIEANARFKF